MKGLCYLSLASCSGPSIKPSHNPEGIFLFDVELLQLSSCNQLWGFYEDPSSLSFRIWTNVPFDVGVPL
jgi:hypothetical protein